MRSAANIVTPDGNGVIRDGADELGTALPQARFADRTSSSPSAPKRPPAAIVRGVRRARTPLAVGQRPAAVPAARLGG